MLNNPILTEVKFEETSERIDLNVLINMIKNLPPYFEPELQLEKCIIGTECILQLPEVIDDLGEPYIISRVTVPTEIANIVEHTLYNDNTEISFFTITGDPEKTQAGIYLIFIEI